MAEDEHREGGTILGGALDEVNVVLLAPLGGHLSSNNAVLAIDLVGNDEHGEIVVALLADLRSTPNVKKRGKRIESRQAKSKPELRRPSSTGTTHQR